MEAPKTAALTKEEEVNENIRQSIELANEIFKVVTNPDYVKATTGQTRYEELNKRYPTFAQHYPVCLRMMAHNGKYNERAFRQFLEKQRKDPGKGMIGFIERQADYARFLYIEDTKANKRHVSMKIAAKIWQEEYAALKKWVDKLKKDEDDAKSLYEAEQARHREQKKQELLDFINEQSPPLYDEDPKPTLAETDELPEEQAKEAANVTAIAPSIADLDDKDMSYEELVVAYRDLRCYADELNTTLNQMDRYIEQLEAEAAEGDLKTVVVPDEWISPDLIKEEKAKKVAEKKARAEEAKRIDAEVDQIIAELGLGKGKKSAKTGTAKSAQKKRR